MTLLFGTPQFLQGKGENQLPSVATQLQDKNLLPLASAQFLQGKEENPLPLVTAQFLQGMEVNPLLLVTSWFQQGVEVNQLHIATLLSQETCPVAAAALPRS